MSNTPIIKCDNLTKHYFLGVTRKRVESLNDLNLEIHPGEVFAYIGLNGAGKSTTIKLLLDHAKPTKGSVSVFGRNATETQAREKIGYMPDVPHFYRFLNVRELLDYFGKLFDLDKSTRRARIEELIELVGLTGRGEEPLLGFSRGMLQRAALAQALINDPDLLILDEPLGGLDPIGRADLMNIMRDLKSRGKTLFFSSHILEDAQKIADRVGILHEGKLLACGELDELLEVEPGWDIEIRSDNGVPVEKIALTHDWRITTVNGKSTLHLRSDSEVKVIYKLADAGEITISSLNKVRLNLEELFLKEVGKWQQ